MSSLTGTPLISKVQGAYLCLSTLHWFCNLDHTRVIVISILLYLAVLLIFTPSNLIFVYRPDLTLSLAPPHVPNKVKPGETVNVKVEFDLPSDVKELTNCKLMFDGSALEAPVEFQLP